MIFSVTESALFLGHLATYDAPSLFLLALATWIVVRTASFRWPGYLLAAPPIALAVATKYAAGLFVPTIVVLSALAAWPYRGRKALIAPAGLAAAVAALLGGGPVPGRADLPDRRQVHHHGPVPGHHRHLAPAPGQPVWGGLPFALALIGTVAYAIRPRTEPGELIADSGGPGLADHPRRRADRDRAAGARGPDPHPHPDLTVEAHRLRALLRRALSPGSA